MLTLYYAKNTCAFAAHVVLEDANAIYQTVEIDFKQAEQNSSHYKKRASAKTSIILLYGLCMLGYLSALLPLLYFFSLCLQIIHVDAQIYAYRSMRFANHLFGFAQLKSAFKPCIVSNTIYQITRQVK